MNLVEKVKKLCEERGISVPKLEKELGFGNGAIYNWNKSSPSIDKVTKVAQFFGVTTDYLLGVSDEQDSFHFIASFFHPFPRKL